MFRCAGYCRTEGCVCGGPAGLVIYENDALRSLDGLRRVSSVAGVLPIQGNQLLATLDGLRALTSLGGDVSVVRNPSIPTCEVTALLERLRALGWSGESFFDGTCM